jgi:hypothetical protein
MRAGLGAGRGRIVCAGGGGTLALFHQPAREHRAGVFIKPLIISGWCVNPDKPGQVSNDASKVQGVIAGPDLKPLYDFALDCKTFQAKLTIAQSDLADGEGNDRHPYKGTR